MSNTIMRGSELLEKVCEAVGVDFQKTRRIVLDIPFDDWVAVYVEMIGDERLLEISTTLNGVEKEVISVNDMKVKSA